MRLVSTPRSSASSRAALLDNVAVDDAGNEPIIEALAAMAARETPTSSRCRSPSRTRRSPGHQREAAAVSSPPIEPCLLPHISRTSTGASSRRRRLLSRWPPFPAGIGPWVAWDGWGDVRGEVGALWSLRSAPVVHVVMTDE